MNRNCPNCGSESNILVAKAGKQPNDYSLEEISNLFVGLRPEQVFFRYVRCVNCELVYCPEYFSKNQLDNLYSHMPPNLVGDELDIVDKTHSGYSRFIIKRVKQSGTDLANKSLLELGADLGLVTGPIVKSLKIGSGVLIEPNLDVRKELLNAVGNNPKFIISNDFREHQQSNSEKFHLVIAIHVVDHLLDPKFELRDVYDSMTKGSHMFIVVHNQKSLLARAMRAKWPPYCLQHPQLFDKKSLSVMLEDIGFQVVGVSRTTNFVGLRNGLRTLLEILRIPNKWLRFLPNIPVPVKYGNIMLEARKTL